MQSANIIINNEYVISFEFICISVHVSHSFELDAVWSLYPSSQPKILISHEIAWIILEPPKGSLKIEKLNDVVELFGPQRAILLKLAAPVIGFIVLNVVDVDNCTDCELEWFKIIEKG